MFWNMPSPGQVAQPRPQHSDISTVPAPWQRLHNGASERASSSRVAGGCVVTVFKIRSVFP
jgi:hypothetical protein